jgi:hypothetical protein
MRLKLKTATFFLALIILLGSGLSGAPQKCSQAFTTNFKFDSSDIVVTRQGELVKLSTQIDFQKSDVKISISAGKERQPPKTFDCLNFLNKLEPYCSDSGDYLGTR